MATRRPSGNPWRSAAGLLPRVDRTPRKRGRRLIDTANEAARALELLSKPRRDWSPTERAIARRVTNDWHASGGLITSVLGCPWEPPSRRPGRKPKITVEQAQQWLRSFESARASISQRAGRPVEAVTDGEVLRWYAKRAGEPAKELAKFLLQLQRRAGGRTR